MLINKIIVAIGGGEIANHETLAIEKRIIKLTGKRRPKVLFIPTASSDDDEYCRKVDNYFGKYLNCHVSVLRLCSSIISIKKVKDMILGTDIIYVGGGNTLKMMKLWRKHRVDKLLKKAWNNGIVLCGISAGAICWFDGGFSDSMSFYNPKDWDYINVRGLGLLKGIMCPHYNSGTYGVPRKRKFQKMIGKNGGIGIAIEDGCAIEFIGNSLRVIRARANADSYKLYKMGNRVISESLV